MRGREPPDSGPGKEPAALTASSRRRAAVRAALLAVGLCTTAGPAAGAEQEIARDGIWSVVRVDDPFATPQRRCEVRSNLPGGDGGRREQGRIRVELSGGETQLFVDPPLTLTHAVRLRRAVLDKRAVAGAERRTDLADTVTHSLRVDQGKVHRGRVSPPGFEPWDASGAVDDMSALIDSMAAGKTLYYGWRLEPAEASDGYNLSGFDRMLETARQSCSG